MSFPSAETSLAQHQDFALYSSHEFFRNFTDDVRNCGDSDRIGLLTMLYDPTDVAVRALTTELHNALSRGSELTMGRTLLRC
jgi:hypothetical protein